MVPGCKRVAVVTGASSGLGKVVAKDLVSRGWKVIGQGRDAARMAAAQTEIRAAADQGGEISMLQCDLSSLAEVANMVRDIAARTERVDVLINNAGGMRDRRDVTREGNEATFAGNHLGHFMLTKGLMALLRHAATDAPKGAVRVINVSSLAHRMSQGIDWNDLQHLNDWTAMASYSSVKLATILFTQELARRLGPEGIVAHAMHPGIVGTNFASHAPAETQAALAAIDCATPEQGADTLSWLATTPEVGTVNGLYYFNRAPEAPSPLADDPASAERIWRESEALLARSGY